MDEQQEAAFAQPMLDPDGLRFSRLKLMGESPLHYLANVQQTSKSMDIGTAVHALLLGGKRVTFYDRVTANGSSAPRRGKDWEDFKALNADATILAKSDYEAANRMADAIRPNALAMRALTGICEETIRFKYLNLDCRSTPDTRAADGSYFSELKTCKSSNPYRFTYQSRSMSYHAQMAFHREAMRRAGMWKEKPPEPFIVAVCSSPPYPVTVFKLTEQAMELGDRMIRMWVEQLKQCIQAKQFPAYSQAVVDLDVPDNELVFADGETESDNIPF